LPSDDLDAEFGAEQEQRFALFAGEFELGQQGIDRRGREVALPATFREQLSELLAGKLRRGAARQLCQ